MRGCKPTVKRLDAELAGVLLETTRVHQRNSTESPHVGVMQSSTVVEIEAQRGIPELVTVKISVVDQESAGEARLYDEPITRIQIDHDELRATPTAEDGGVLHPPGERARIHLAQHIVLPN